MINLKQLYRAIGLMLMITIFWVAFIYFIGSVIKLGFESTGSIEGEEIHNNEKECFEIKTIEIRYWDIKNNIIVSSSTYVNNVSKIDCGYYERELLLYQEVKK